MSLEISQLISDAVDIVLLTFILAWRERQRERVKSVNFHFNSPLMPLSSLDD